MAIEETRKRIHFVPFDIKKGREKDTDPAPTITVGYGSLRFSKKLITELNLNGKFVKFFYDRIKGVIGFQVKDKAMLGAMSELKGEGKWKMVKQNDTSGQWAVSVKKMMASQFGEHTLTKIYPRLPVKKYIESSDLMMRGETFYFIEIIEEHDPKNPAGSKPDEEPKDLEEALEEMTAV